MERHEHIPGMISNKMKLRNLLIALLIIINFISPVKDYSSISFVKYCSFK